MMLVARLKPAAWAFLAAVSVSAGAVGLTSTRAQQPPGYTPAQSTAAGLGQVAQSAPAQDDLEALRLEVDALRRELRATKERVKALEADRGRRPAAGGASKMPPGTPPTGTFQRSVTPPAHDPRTKPEGGTAPSSNGAPPLDDAASVLPPASRQESESSFLLRSAAEVPPDAGYTPPQGSPPGGKARVREKVETREEADPAWAAQEALRRLQKNPNDRQAVEALERAVRRLKERTTPADSPSRR